MKLVNKSFFLAAVKRILKEVQELHEPTEEYFAAPLDENLFEWHFTIRGPIDSDFEEGIYHGRIQLPNEYPMKPPNIIFTTVSVQHFYTIGSIYSQMLWWFSSSKIVKINQLNHKKFRCIEPVTTNCKLVFHQIL